MCIINTKSIFFINETNKQQFIMRKHVLNTRNLTDEQAVLFPYDSYSSVLATIPSFIHRLRKRNHFLVNFATRFASLSEVQFMIRELLHTHTHTHERQTKQSHPILLSELIFGIAIAGGQIQVSRWQADGKAPFYDISSTRKEEAV